MLSIQLVLWFAESFYCYKITRIAYTQTIKTNLTFAMIIFFHFPNSFIVAALKYPYGWSPSHSKHKRNHKTKKLSQCNKIAACNAYSLTNKFPSSHSQQKAKACPSPFMIWVSFILREILFWEHDFFFWCLPVEEKEGEGGPLYQPVHCHPCTI